MTTTTEHYDEGIARLSAYANDEADEDLRNGAEAKIEALILAKAEQNFDAMSQRNPKLQALMSDLQAIINNASGTSPAQAIASLTGYVSILSEAINES